MTKSLTPTLDEIAAKGNRGHNLVDNNWITCRDGTEISIIAGGGTYSHPRVQFCFTATDGEHDSFPISHNEEPCNYPGPYTHVEVMMDGDVETMSVLAARDLILRHGGEKVEGESDEDRAERMRQAQELVAG